MTISDTFVDPFGAPEFLVEGVAAREMIGTELLRLTFFAHDGMERVLKVKLLIPVDALLLEQPRTTAFVRSRIGAVAQ